MYPEFQIRIDREPVGEFFNDTAAGEDHEEVYRKKTFPLLKGGSYAEEQLMFVCMFVRSRVLARVRQHHHRFLKNLSEG